MIGHIRAQEQSVAKRSLPEEDKSARAQVKVWRVSLQLVTCALVACALLRFSDKSFAQESGKLVDLSKQIMEAKTGQDSYAFFEELKDLYFKDNRYSEFVDFLKSLRQKKSNIEAYTSYYIALARYAQLKHLEEAQSWDEYFSSGNAYRQEMQESVKKTVELSPASDKLKSYAQLILWKSHKDQQDAFSEEALAALTQYASEYAETASIFSPLKEIADQLVQSGEKIAARKLYRIYADKLSGSDIQESGLAGIAEEFYEQGNIELSETVYEAYLDRVLSAADKEKAISALLEVAAKFSYKDEGPSDAAFAEKIFQKVESLGLKDAFDEATLYRRGLNLEKSKEYLKAKDVYLQLLSSVEQSPYADRINFKIGVISAYIGRDIGEAEKFFEQLSNKDDINPYVISSLYQLGLLNQWQGDLIAASDYYHKVIDKAGDAFQDTAALAKLRLNEADNHKEIEYNLKTFLEASLNPQSPLYDATNLDLKAVPSGTKTDQEVNITSLASLPQSGCMQVEVQYLWSGDLGTVRSEDVQQPSFLARYLYPGSKIVNLVVVTPSGVVDRNIYIVDIE